MAIKINFDATNNPEKPTIILAKRNGDKIGLLDAHSIEVSEPLNGVPEISFVVYKHDNGVLCNLWDQITNFKLIYCIEWNMWFEISVETDESCDTIKTVSCVNLGCAELSQIMIYNTEINTESDILRDDYTRPTVVYNPLDVSSSLLHRITEKARHYSITHVDSTISNIQRTFTFDDISIYDACQEIAEEVGCLFVFKSNSDDRGRIQRTISVYDLESNCRECGYRGEFTQTCPKCGSGDINEGYGEDTTILITSDDLADNINLSVDVESVKNCFKLEAGDDLMTATIRNCNPNGTDYIWYFSDEIKNEMSDDLSVKINEYNDLYNFYQNDYYMSFQGFSTIFDVYNFLVDKYAVYNKDLQRITPPVVGYTSLTKAYYNVIDFANYLQIALMPTVQMQETSAVNEATKLKELESCGVAVTNISNISTTVVNNAVIEMAQTLVDFRYKLDVVYSDVSISDNACIWTGELSVTNRSDEEDAASTETLMVSVDDNYAAFIRQKLDKALNKCDSKNLSVTTLFKIDKETFKTELQKYSLNYLNLFYNTCQTCIDVLIEQGVGDNVTWAGKVPNLYDDLYVPYLDKLSAIESEIQVRQSEIDLIAGSYDLNNNLKTVGIQNLLEEEKSKIQSSLNIQKFLGDDLWVELCSFRRECKYTNSNYTSDGLSNAELFDNAKQFIEVAQTEIYKSAELQHSLSATLHNLLVMPKFKVLVDKFCVGNWLRVIIDDKLYKLRLIRYGINYDDLNNISVEFSDVTKVNSTIKSVQDVISQATTIASSYEYVQKQAQKGEDSNVILEDWISNGLKASNTKIIGGADNQTQTWDEHGMLFRKYDSLSNEYEDTQLKIVNSTICITNNNWNTVKTAIGMYYYFDPETGKLMQTYGVNAETIVGDLILGQNLQIHSENGDMTFDKNGLTISSDTTGNAFAVDANSDILLSISHDGEKVFYIDDNGVIHISGDGNSLEISKNTDITQLNLKVSTLSNDVSAEVNRATAAEDTLDKKIDNINSDIRSEIYQSVKSMQSEIASSVSNHNTSNTAHNDMRLLIKDLTDRLNVLADSDDSTLDQLSEIVAYIKSNKALIDSVTTNKISYADVIDNLTTNVNNKPLSAGQGVVLKSLFDSIPNWAKTESKPTYKAAEIDELFSTVYPVGSTYISANNMNPQILFGGTWEQIEGSFVLSDNTQQTQLSVTVWQRIA